MKVYCLETFDLISWIIIIVILPYIFIPNSFIFLTVINICSLYFLINSMKVYYFDENGFTLKYRFIKRTIISLEYEKLEKITFLYTTGFRSSHVLTLYSKDKIEKVLPNISKSNWSDVEEIITFLQDKGVQNKGVKLIRK